MNKRICDLISPPKILDAASSVNSVTRAIDSPLTNDFNVVSTASPV